jgi:hypothetical protein
MENVNILPSSSNSPDRTLVNVTQAAVSPDLRRYCATGGTVGYADGFAIVHALVRPRTHTHGVE